MFYPYRRKHTLHTQNKPKGKTKTLQKVKTKSERSDLVVMTYWTPGEVKQGGDQIVVAAVVVVAGVAVGWISAGRGSLRLLGGG